MTIAAMTIAEVQADHYRIPLPVTLSDSTHGEISHFELITLRLRDAEGAEGGSATPIPWARAAPPFMPCSRATWRRS